MSFEFIEYSIISEPADGRSFVGYNHTLPGNPSPVNWSVVFSDPNEFDIEEVLLDRFRDLFMEVEGIEPEPDAGSTSITEILELAKEIGAEPNPFGNPDPWSQPPDINYGPIWVVDHTTTVPNEYDHTGRPAEITWTSNTIEVPR